MTQSISRELRIAALQAFRPYFGRIPHNQDYFDFDENFGSRLNPNRTKQEYLQDMLGMAKESIQQFKERTEVIHSPLTAHYAKNSVSIALAQVADIMPDSGFYRAALEDATDTVGICALVQKVEARFNSLTV